MHKKDTKGRTLTATLMLVAIAGVCFSLSLATHAQNLKDKHAFTVRTLEHCHDLDK